MDQHLKNRSVHDRLGKRVVDQNWADDKEESNEEEYIWQEGQWCLGGLTRSQKRRVQRLRNRELEQAQASGKIQVWRTKQIADRKQPEGTCLVGRPMVPRRFNKKPEEKGATLKE